MRSFSVGNECLLPDAVVRVARTIRARVKKAILASAECKGVMNEASFAGAKDRRELYAESRMHNAEAISQAGKATEALLALCKGLNTNERLSHTTAGKHALKPAYDDCIKSVDGEKREHLQHTFDCAYHNALYRHFTDVHVDENVVGTIVDPPFLKFSLHDMHHGQVIYRDGDFGAFGGFGSGAGRKKGRAERLDTIGGYLSVFDHISQEFVKKKGEWVQQSASWRSIDYDAREDSSSWTILNGNFFSTLAYGLLPILDDVYFWHENYFTVWMKSKGVVNEDKVLHMIQQNWSPEIAGEVIGKLRGSFQDKQTRAVLRDRPQLNSIDLKVLRRHTVRKVEFSSPSEAQP